MAAPGRTLTVYLATDTKRAQAGMAGFMKDMSKMAGAAAIAGAAIAAKLGVDGVQAAAAAQVQVQKLDSQLANLGKSAESAGIQQWIDDMQFATGVSEDELYPALQKLIAATGDVGKAQKALKLSMDIAAQGTKTVDQAATSLSKAYAGNVAALGKLTPELGKAYLKTASVEDATRKLTDLYGGAADAQAKTYQGTINRLTIGMGELQESFGTGFLEGFTGALGDGADGSDSLTDALRDLQPQMQALGDTIGTFTADLVKLVGWIAQVYQAAVDLGGSNNSALAALGKTFAQMTNPMGSLMDGLQQVQDELNQTSVDAWHTASETSQAMQSIDPGFLAGDFGGGTFADSGAAAAASTWSKKYMTQAAQAIELSKRLADAHARQAAAAKAAAAATGGGGGSLAGSVDKVSAADKKLIAQQDQLNTRLDRQLAHLNDAQQAWDDLAKAADDYSASISDAITQSISLGDAMSQQMADAAKPAGEQAGITWLDAFRKQLADASAFGNALKGLAGQPGVTQAFVDQVAGVAGAAGVPAATELVNALLSQQGLAGQLSTELTAAMSASGSVGQVFASTFYSAGLASAQDTVDGFATGVANSQKQLVKIGKALGDPIAASMIDTIKAALDAAMASWQQTNAWRGAPQLRSVGGTATRSTAPQVNVTVQAGVGDPVAIARTIQNVLATQGRRLGAR